MLIISLVFQIVFGTSIALAIVTPSQLYEMVDHVVDLYMNDSCLVVISSDGYTAASHVPAVYVDPYNQVMKAQNENFIPEESYKMVTMAPILELGCTGFLIQVENPGRQLRLIEKTFMRVNQRTQRRFIFVPTVREVTERLIETRGEVLDSENFDFRSVLREKSVEYISDMIITVPNDEDDDVTLLTHRFTGPGDQGHEEILLDTYDVVRRRFKLGANLFPDKIKDLEGKVLKVAIINYPPCVIINHNNQSIRIDGHEWRFVQEFAKQHNCSLKEVIDNENAWGNINNNVIKTGIIGKVIGDEADMATAGLYATLHPFQFLDVTTPFYRSGVTCLVPLPRELPHWISPLLPFSPGLWTTFVGMTIVSTIITGMVNQAESILCSEDSFRMTISEVVLTVAGITFLQGLRKDPKGSAWAILSITLLIVSLLLVTAYGSSLSSAMTVPRYEEPVDSAVELAARGIPWGERSMIWISPIVDADEPEMRTLVKNYQELSTVELAKKSADTDDWGFLIERIHGYYVIPDYISLHSLKKMHMMKNDIYWGYSISMLRKSSPFTKWYSQRILEIQASGIPAYWRTETALHYLDPRKQLVVKTDHAVRDGPVRITIDQVQGTFLILVIGLILSGLIFLGELYTFLQNEA